MAIVFSFAACDSGGGGGTGPGTDPGTGPGAGPGTGPGTGPDPGTGPGTGPGSGPGTGTVWTAVPNSIPTTIANLRIRALEWGGDKFVIGADNKLAYSSDGKNWTVAADSTFASENVRDIAWGNDTFVAVGSSAKIAYSSDGITWTAVADEDNAFIGIYGGKSGVISVTYGGGKFVAGGGGLANGGSSIIAYSSDGITWTAASGANSIFGTSGVSRLVYGDGTFLAAALLDKMAYSTDGVTWTAVTQSIFSLLPSGGSNSLNAIAYGNGKFLATGFDGTIAYSTNGETWTVVANNPFYYPYKFADAEYDTWKAGAASDPVIAYGGGKFVAVNYGGKTGISTDGVTWTIVADRVFGNYIPGTQEAMVYNAIEQIAYDGSKFIVMSPYSDMKDGVAYWDGN